MTFETVIGLEVHVELSTKTKMFCGCKLVFGDKPNSSVCPICLGHPGSLPVINEQAVEYAIRLGLALDCSIASVSKFDRKNYFYPDLPKGYQISQFDQPICGPGELVLDSEGGGRTIRILRAHLEEDAGKLIHQSPTGRLDDSTGSFVDLNRAGTPLIEIVSEPDMRTPGEAESYLKLIRELVVSLGISHGNMEEGNLRCDANISLRPQGETKLGTKVEIKNMNSFRGVRLALEHEIKRQTQALDQGQALVQETRLWQEKGGKTISMRSKEDAHDYRFFPEPDLPPLNISRKRVDDTRKTLPELLPAKRTRFVASYGLSEYDAKVLTGSPSLADYFEEALGHKPSKEAKNWPKTMANWICNDLMGLLPRHGLKEPRDSKVGPKDLAELAGLVESKKITGKSAKDVLVEMVATGKSAKDLVAAGGMEQISDEGAIGKLIQKVLEENPKVVEQYKGGKTGAIGFLMGQLMKASKGQANPQTAKKALEDALKS